MARARARRAEAVAVSRPGALLLARAVVGVGVLLSAAYWVAVAFARREQLHLGAFDFAFFDQVVWNTAHGRFFETTFVPYNFAGQHTQPVLLLFAGAYRLGAGAMSLLVVQAAVCALAAVPLFEAGRRLRLPTVVAAAAALAYLANPYLHRALAFDFHPETMVALPAFGALWAFAAGRPRLGAAVALSALLFKEDAAFVVLALALAAWSLDARREARALAAGAAAWAVLTVFVLMPLVRDGQPSDLVERYGAVLGGREGLAGVLWSFTHPVEVLRVALAPERLGTAVTFVLASGPWLLLAPLQALALLPGLALGLLSSHGAQQELAFHYGVQLVPLAAIAGLFGARRLLLVLPAGAPAAGVLAGAMIVVAAVGLASVGPASPLAAGGPSEAHRAAVERAVALVPEGAAVSAQSNLAARVAHRRQLWEFPGQWERADLVLVDRYGFRSTQSLDAGFDAALEDVRARGRLLFEEDGVALYDVSGPPEAAR
ncbi:MAG: DUF2079 domain-containing protein [Dehalococcoidia bacterium]